MSRYIDADCILYKDLSEGRGACWVTFRDWIKEMPTADVVEVVRCKDCKHRPVKDDRDSWPIFLNEEDNPCPCRCDDGFYSWFPKDDFYCSYGERAEE